ncbi:hypothetical protein BC628DRAFT_111288 [Trametes gibbosa]|nr:hypothetical protein BC628DRAFT_613171 [Trametes gibbosa]KAI0828318.1 hypothetical protein BC628DRAFT_111288 [Trametes gibbosa]
MVVGVHALLAGPALCPPQARGDLYRRLRHGTAAAHADIDNVQLVHVSMRRAHSIVAHRVAEVPTAASARWEPGGHDLSAVWTLRRLRLGASQYVFVDSSAV